MKFCIWIVLSLLKIIHKRSTLGLYDNDLQLFKDFGFVEGQIVTFIEKHSPDLKTEVEESISKWMGEVK